MKWVWIMIGACLVAFLVTFLTVMLTGCGEPSEPIVGQDITDYEEVEEVTERQVGERIGPAPISTPILAYVQQHPTKAEPACRNICEKVNGKLYRVGPADNRWGWECLCSWEE